MKYIDKGQNIKEIKECLELDKKSESCLLQIIGKSGTGKTELIKETHRNIINRPFAIYCNMVEDEFVRYRFFENIILNIFHPITDEHSHIPENLCFSSFIKQTKKSKKQYTSFVEWAQIALSAIPTIGGPISIIAEKFIPDEKSFYDIQPIFWEYLDYVTKKVRLNIIIDNIQFVPQELWRLFELGINNHRKGVSLIIIERTEDKSTFAPNICFESKKMELQPFSKIEFQQLIEYESEIIKKHMIEIFIATKGNPKEIQLCFNNLNNNPNYNVMETSVAIKNLGDLQRVILLLASLLPAGLKEPHFIKAVQHIMSNTEQQVKEDIALLIRLGYIKKNSFHNDVIKPSHEKVTILVREITDKSDVYLIQNRLKDLLEVFVSEAKNTSDYGYMLHCLVGIINTVEVIDKTYYIEELVKWNFKNYAYYYVTSIYHEIDLVVPFLDCRVTEKILISCQRVSDFTTGKKILKSLEIKNPNTYAELLKYHIKFAIQSYDFIDALEAISKIKKMDSSLYLCKLNALQHLSLEEEVISLLSIITTFEKDENYYIMLRNTAEYYNYQDAFTHLNDVIEYFDKKNPNEFALATAYNNMSVINIWKKQYGLAHSNVMRAHNMLQQLQSNEIFESWCNLGVLHLLQAQYSESMSAFYESRNVCPRELTMDLLMININLVIAKILIDEYNIQEGLHQFLLLSENYTIIEDPWYHFQLHYNADVLRQLCDTPTHLKYNSKYIDEYENELTKYYIIHSTKINGKNARFSLGLSPNWRY